MHLQIMEVMVVQEQQLVFQVHQQDMLAEAVVVLHMDLLVQVVQQHKVVELEQVEILVVLELRAQLTEVVVAVDRRLYLRSGRAAQIRHPRSRSRKRRSYRWARAMVSMRS